ncbi:MAG: hypothetical protein R3208_13600, partial [Ketobacteraceae bacterium]|nr:hypothetical protein [Ketobacteraceae bacterium]
TACDGIDLSGTEVSLTRTGATGDIVFEPSGMTNFDLILTVAHEDIGSHEYEIRILRSGRISLKQKPI